MNERSIEDIEAKNRCIKAIYTHLLAQHGYNFQLAVREILTLCYGNDFEMPMLGLRDKGNDGWIKSRRIFLQIYAPMIDRSSETLKSNVEKKYKTDIGTLCNHIKNGLWGGSIKEYIFIVNCRGLGLPENSNDFYKKIDEEIFEEFGFQFTTKQFDETYLLRILEEIDDVELLHKILGRLGLSINIAYSISSISMFEFIKKIGIKINDKFIKKDTSPILTRIPNLEKIDINNLTRNKDEMITLIEQLDVVDEAKEMVLSDGPEEAKSFERLKDYTISLYSNSKGTMSNDDLLEYIYNALNKEYGGGVHSFIPIKLFVVYIFDMCDIFETSIKETIK